MRRSGPGSRHLTAFAAAVRRRGRAAFYLAWVDATDAFAPEHVREDEDVFAFTVSQTEGDFASLEIDIRNPRVGLLSAGRKQWAWLSWDNGSEVVPLFFGRLVGMPDNIHQEIVKLIFTARPIDFGAQKEALAASLRVPPFWEPIFIEDSKLDDPDAVLEARTALWHIDRVTHALTTSDILVGEDGIEEFLASEVPYDSVQTRMGQQPLRSVLVDAQVQWDQASKGELDFIRNASFSTFSVGTLASDWPTAGTSIGGGWTVASGSARTDIDQYAADDFETEITIPAPEGILDDGTEVIEAPGPPPEPKLGKEVPEDWLLIITKYESRAAKNSNSTNVEGVLIPYGTCFGTIRLAYETSRKRTERLTFQLDADVQPILTMPGEDEVLRLAVGGSVDEPLPDASLPPIVDVQRRSYFPTDRGLQSLEYLIVLARSHLIMRSRAVEVSFDCPFERAVTLSCRKNARVYDPRLPGGQAVGKITSYRFSVDGDTGTLIGSLTMGCAIGYGGAVATAPGEPTYVEDGYVDDGYQFREDQIEVVGAGDVGYVVPADNPNDDGLVFPLQQVPLQAPTVFTPFTLTPGTIQQTIPGIEPADIAAGIKASLESQLPNIRCFITPVDGGPFTTTYDVVVSDLKIPAMINLEAGA